jgi:transcriptional regulator with XRE-family HTH domain
VKTFTRRPRKALDDVDFLYEELGRRIRERRGALGVSQKDLAHAVSLSRASIANVEAGNQKILVHTLLAIADALQLNPTELLPVSSGERLELDRLLQGRDAREREWIRAALTKKAAHHA